MKTCELCGKSVINKLSRHVETIHHIKFKQYYDEYFKNPDEGICPICGKETQFIRKSFYRRCCSQSHAAIYRQSYHNVKDLIKQFEIENDCTNIVSLRNKYGQGWYKAKIVDYIESNFFTKIFYVKNSDIHKIEEYCKSHKYSCISSLEKQIVEYLKTLDISIIENDRQQIKPKELDIYLPQYNIGVEFNGTWYHSIEAGAIKDLHLMKSLLCRNKGIRLIHIYEFEDLEQQKQLLKDLILGQDNYPKNDFNKNNLIDNIPEPELIYVSDKGYHVYGAGKLEGSYL